MLTIHRFEVSMPAGQPRPTAVGLRAALVAIGRLNRCCPASHFAGAVSMMIRRLRRTLPGRCCRNKLHLPERSAWRTRITA